MRKFFRAKNGCILLDADYSQIELRLMAHLSGDKAMQEAFLSGADILMIPVGGFFTIDGETAARTVRELSPKVVLPMHYKTKWNESWPISGPEPFYEAMCLPLPDPVPLLRVTAEDISCLPATVLFKVPEE